MYVAIRTVGIVRRKGCAFYYPQPRTGRGAVSYTTGTQADLIQVSQRLAGSNLVDFLNSPTAKSIWIGGVFI